MGDPHRAGGGVLNGKRRWARGRKIVLRGLAGAVLVVLALVLGLFYVPAVARWAVRLGLAQYDGAIAGSLAIARIEGALGGDLELHGVEARDRDGRPLVLADRVRLGLDLPALLQGRVDLGVLRLVGVAIHLPDPGAPGWADLAPAPSAPPVEDEAPAGYPDLPVALRTALLVEDLAVWQGSSPSPAALQVAVPRLELRLAARGRSARATLEMQAAAPAADLDVAGARLTAVWDAPRLTLPTLEVDTSWGTLRMGGASLDFDRRSGALPLLTATLAGDRGRSLTGLDPGGPVTATLVGAGDPSQGRVALAVAAPRLGVLTAGLDGTVTPTLSLAAEIGAALSPTAFHPSLRRDRLRLSVVAHARRDADVHADLHLACLDCADDETPVRAQVDAQASPTFDRGRGDLAIELPGLAVDLTGSLTGDEYRAELSLSARDLARTRALASTFVPVPELAGHGGARVVCEGELRPVTAACRIEADLTEGRPVDALAVAAEVELGERTRIAAETLRAEAQGVRAELVSPRAEIVVDGDRVDARGVDLRVATRSGTARVQAEGTWGGSGAHDLRARAQRLELAALEAFVPHLGLRGRVDASARLQGTLAEPRLQAEVRARRLVYRDRPIGTLRAEARYEREHATAHLELADSPLARVDLRAALPIRLALGAASPVSLPPRGRPRVALAVHEADLATLNRLAPGAPPLTGTVDLDVALAGRWSAPTVTLTLRGADLAYRDEALGELDLAAGLEGGAATAEVAVRHPRWQHLEVEARAPLAVDLARGRVDWRAHEPHAIDLQLERLDLAWLASWVPTLQLAGHLDTAVQVRGTAHAPELHHRLTLDGLAYRDRTVGDLALQLDYAPGEARLLAFGDGPAFEGLGLTAAVPISVDPVAGAVAWDAGSAHRLELALAGLSVRDALAWSPRPLDASGRGRAWLRLSGTPRAPKVDAELDFRSLVYGGRNVGDLRVHTRFAAGRVEAEVRLEHDPERIATVDVALPLEVDLPAGTFVWRRDEDHRIQVVAATLDRALLEPFVALPDGWDLDLGLDVQARGHLEAFRMETRLGGTVTAEGHAPVHVGLLLSADEDAQALVVDLAQERAELLAVRASTSIPIAAALAGGDAWRTSPLALEARARGTDLAFLSGLGRGVVAEPRGRLDLEVSASGTLGDPALRGELAVRDAEITVVPLRQRFERMEVDLGFDGPRIALEKLALRSGEGRLEAQGRLDLATPGAVRGTLRVDLARLPLQQPGLPRMRLDARIDATAEATPTRTEVQVGMRGAKVDVSLRNVAAPKAIPESDRVHYVALPEDGSLPPAPATGGSSELAAAAPAPPGSTFAASLTLHEPLRIVGPAVDMSWKGKVSTTVEGGDVRAEGALQADRGGFDLLGNRFVITAGSVTLAEAGDLVPYLDLVATTTVDAVTITAKVRGRATAPSLSFTSSPPFPESEIFKMLVTGSSDTQAADPDEVQAQAASVLTAFINPTLQRELGRALRVDRIGASFGESTDQPILSVGKNVTRKLYVESQYHHLAPRDKNRAQLTVEYELAPRWSLETFYGDHQVGGADVFWRLFF